MAASKTVKKKNDVDANTLSKIEKLARNTLGEANKGKNPALDIRTRTLSNVSFNVPLVGFAPAELATGDIWFRVRDVAGNLSDWINATGPA